MHAARFAAINVAAVALLALATAQGWVVMIVEADRSRLTLVIAGVLALGLFLCGWRLATLRHLPTDWNRQQTRLDDRTATIRLLIELCPLLGLAGTVVGFIIAFASLDLAALTDASSAAATIGDVLAGVGIALYTTLTGLVAAVWLSLAYRTVESRVAELQLA